VIKVVLASFDRRLDGSVNLHSQYMNIRQGDGYTLLFFVYRVAQIRDISHTAELDSLVLTAASCLFLYIS